MADLLLTRDTHEDDLQLRSDQASKAADVTRNQQPRSLSMESVGENGLAAPGSLVLEVVALCGAATTKTRER
jgi:hypothetical protein